MAARPLDIVLIEDCKEDIDLIEEVFREHSLQNKLTAIGNGSDALFYLKNCSQQKTPRPDVIVLDLNIPKKNGFEVLREIAQDDNLNKIPLIVFTTSYLTPEILQEYKIDLGRYVRKSVDFRELVEAIRTVDEKEKLQVSQPQHDKQNVEMRILLVEDNIEDAELIEEMLFMKQKTAWRMKNVKSLEACLDTLKKEAFDVVVLDLFLPDSQGMQTLKKCVDKGVTQPLVVMTSLRDESNAKEAVHQGAQDYLIKGQITADQFLRTVEFAVERKKMERLKDELISYVNHELTNPLMIIKETVSQVKDGLLGDVNQTQKEYLLTASLTIDRLIKLTEDLLVGTTLELGKLPIKKEEFNFNELIQEVINSFKSALSKKGLSVHCRLPSEPVLVNADRERIGQVVSNLLNNALKYTAEGSIEIAMERNGDYVQCRISDTGQGIAPEDLPKLFKKYEQILGNKGKKQKGTGLGLYICKMLIELHGGNIAVNSKPGTGSTFIFSLPKDTKEVGNHDT